MKMKSTGSIRTGTTVRCTVIAMAWLVVLTPAHAEESFFRSLGASPNPSVYISPNGQYIAGWLGDTANTAAPARWTIAGEQVILPLTGSAHGISNDGVLVGETAGQAFLWSDTAGVTYLEPPEPSDSSGYSLISADGSTILGWLFWYRPDGNVTRTFRVTNSRGFELLPASTEWMEPLVQSSDGSEMIGWERLKGGTTYRYFRWTEQAGMTPFVAAPPLGYSTTLIDGGTPDLSTLVGNASNGLGCRRPLVGATTLAGLRSTTCQKVTHIATEASTLTIFRRTVRS